MSTFHGLAFSSNPISLNVDEQATEGWVETLPLCHTTWVEFVWIPRWLKSDTCILNNMINKLFAASATALMEDFCKCGETSSQLAASKLTRIFLVFCIGIDVMYVYWRGDSSKYLSFTVFNLGWCSQSRLWFLNRFGGESLTRQRMLAFNQLLASCRKLRNFYYFDGSASKANSLQSQKETNEMSVIFIN